MKTRFLLILMSFTIGIVILFVTAENSEGKTITVDDDGGADYKKIQDAIDAAEDGDTVRVYGGLYNEKVVVNKSINLVGNGSEINLVGNESEITTIVGRGTGDVVHISANWVNISGFNVTGSGNDSDDTGIQVESDNIHIFDNNCSNNHCGIRLWRSDYCTIENNTCSSNNRYGIKLENSRDCFIENNDGTIRILNFDDDDHDLELEGYRRYIFIGLFGLLLLLALHSLTRPRNKSPIEEGDKPSEEKE